jgi:PDZ domain-containing protein
MALPVVVLIGWATGFSIPEYSISPGQAIDTATLVTVPQVQPKDYVGSIYMTDVTLTHLTPILWIYDHVVSDVSIYPASEIVGSSDPSQFSQQQLSQMANAKLAAGVAAFSYLNRRVPEVYGAEVLATVPGTPAYGVLRPGDLVTEVGGKTVTSMSTFAAAITSYPPGSVVRLLVIRQNVNSSSLDFKRISFTVKLGSDPRNGKKAFLGVEYTQGVFYVLPGSIKIATGEIGGPSAGLAFALQLVQELSHHRFARGVKVAATGTIAPNGIVGEVGGVPQKAVAVYRAGVKIFLVPKQQVSQARTYVGKKLTIIGVSSLSQAIDAIKGLRGIS